MPAKSRQPDDPTFTVTASELALLLRAPRTTIYRLRDQGLLAAKEGRYSLSDVMVWLYGEQGTTSKADLDLNTARRDLAVAQKMKIDQELSERRKELLPTDEMQLAFMGLAQLLIDGLSTLAPRAAPAVASLSDPAVCEAAIDNEVENVRVSLANRVREFEGDFGPGGQHHRTTPDTGSGAMGGSEQDDRRDSGSGAGAVQDEPSSVSGTVLRSDGGTDG